MSESLTNQIFIHEDFLLESKSAKVLYHDYVKELPIIDYHNHLSPKAIYEDKIYDSITSLWLEGDHINGGHFVLLELMKSILLGKQLKKKSF